MRLARLPVVALAGLVVTVTLVRAPVPVQASPPDEAADADWDEVVSPFVARHCAGCHGARDPEAGLALTGRAREDLARDLATWSAVVDKLRAGEMPPEGADSRPSALEVEAVAAWLDDALAPARRAALQEDQDPGRVTLRRLNRAEYRHTVQDLLGVAAVSESDFTDDDVGYGFDTVGDVLSVPPVLVERYVEVAERLAATVVQDLEPVRVRVEAEEAERSGSGGVKRGFAVLASAGSFAIQVVFPAAGDYVVRVRAYGEQAGPEPARLAVQLGRDRSSIVTHDVRATRGGPEVYETTVRVKGPGTHSVSAAFTNDYWVPDHPDPKQRDRNLAVDWLEVEGPREALVPSAAQRALAPRRPRERDDVRPCAREALGPLVARAFRRPVTPDEVERYVALVDLTVADGGSFEQGLRLALQAVLVSPHFLYKVEVDPDPSSTAPHDVSEHELAVRLSYYLWSGPPDDALRALADAGQLRARLDQEVARLLDDPRATRFVEQFAGQWLQLRRLSQASPDPDRFAFDDELREAMRVESELVFEAILREGRGALELIDAPFTFVNERLARHYGVPGVSGPRFRRVATPRERGGVLGHAGVLTVTSNPTRTSPVKRGKWVLEVLLDEPPPPPLPGMDTLPEVHDGDEPASLRERLERHRADVACAQCHQRMDPLGYGLERFDAVGLWRETEDGLPIDSTGRMPGGPPFDGLQGLQGYLRRRGPAVVRALAAKLLTFALGRGPAPGDAAALDALVARTGPAWRLRDIVAAVVRTPAFQRRRGEEPK